MKLVNPLILMIHISGGTIKVTDYKWDRLAYNITHKANSRCKETYMFVLLCVRIILRCILYDLLVFKYLFHGV